MSTVFGGTIDAPTDEMIASPLVWRDHKGTDYRLSEMETSHLVNIVRLIVNEWAIRHEIEPVPIRNPRLRSETEDAPRHTHLQVRAVWVDNLSRRKCCS